MQVLFALALKYPSLEVVDGCWLFDTIEHHQSNLLEYFHNEYHLATMKYLERLRYSGGAAAL